MSVVWEDEYDPSELGGGFQVETEAWDDDQWDAAAEWLSYEDLAEGGDQS